MTFKPYKTVRSRTNFVEVPNRMKHATFAEREAVKAREESGLPPLPYGLAVGALTYNEFDEGPRSRPTKGLNFRERRFVWFLTHENMTPGQAAIASGLMGERDDGYEIRQIASGESGRAAATKASEFMNRPHIQMAIQQALEEKAHAVGVEQKDVLDIIQEAIQMAKDKGDPMVMLQGADRLARMFGHYEPTKIQVEQNITVDTTVRQIGNMSNDELLKLAQGVTLEGDFTER